jgi:hypothetical protein
VQKKRGELRGGGARGAKAGWLDTIKQEISLKRYTALIVVGVYGR